MSQDKDVVTAPLKSPEIDGVDYPEFDGIVDRRARVRGEGELTHFSLNYPFHHVVVNNAIAVLSSICDR